MRPRDEPMGRSLPVLSSRMATYAALPSRPVGWGEGQGRPLEDARGRRYRYLRLSLTDRCDLACRYCMPAQGEREHALRSEQLELDEAIRLVRVFAEAGLRRVRLTGGEPLVRRGVVDFVEAVAGIDGVEAVAMTTNATRLQHLAGPLRTAGLSQVNISLDTLDAKTFRELTRGGELRDVLAGVDAAVAQGFELKLNIVPLRGINDGELPALVRWAHNLGITPRFIELMPLGEGRSLTASRMSCEEVAQRLGVTLDALASGPGDHGPARYVSVSSGRVGFITPVSDEFCGSCNRIRVNARGDLRACLADRQAVSLRDVMRNDGSDLDLRWAMEFALNAKARGHFFLDEAVAEHELVGMSLIGG